MKLEPVDGQVTSGSDLSQPIETISEELGTLASGVVRVLSPLLSQILDITDQTISLYEGATSEESGLLVDRITRIQRSALACSEILRFLETYSDPSAGNTETCSLNAIIHDVLVLIEPGFGNQAGIALEAQLDPDLPEMRCNRSQIMQMMINLLLNARDAIRQNGTIFLSTSFAGADNEILLEVRDTGVGIAEENRDRIFDPFFTLKPPHDRVGLGLTVVSGIVRMHHGRIQVESALHQGTAFRIFLPVDFQSAAL